jgi:hypothetical protein
LDEGAFANLKMQVSQVAPTGVAHTAQAIPALQHLPHLHGNILEMGIDGLDHASRIRRPDAVSQNHHVAPAWACVVGKDNLPKAGGMDWITEIRVSAANAVEIVTKVAVEAELLCIVGHRAILCAHGPIPSGGQGQGKDLACTELEKSGICRGP